MPRTMTLYKNKKMWARRDVGVLIVVALLMIGCQSNVQVNQHPLPDSVSQAMATPVAPSQGVALLAVDFDPPLDHLELVAGRGVTLMVAVQNLGSRVARHIPVTARLFDGDAPEDHPVLLLESTAFLDQVEPDEIAIVRFDRLTALPLRTRYYLRVEVGGAMGGPGRGQVFEITIVPTPSAVEAVPSE
ncbi:MAG: hypothetical protein GXP39_11625 [Chloroflexi bacterium]|nr:hypothetical protein [Chloroflexota bacterium]